MMDDPATLSAGALAALVGQHRISAAQVLAACLARVAAFNPAVNALCTLNPRAEAEAAECDRRCAAGGPARPLEGVPFVVKDTIETAGVRTTFGSRLMEQHVPAADAVAVERLKAAGGILLGKANTPEFATDINTVNALFEITRNPWDLNTSAGGSSGGTGAALAAGFAPIGLGTDLGGSIRIPASFNGVVGLRPVPGRIPVYPQEFGWDTLVAHVTGPMARDVSDIGLLLSVLAGPDDRDPSSLPAQGCDYLAAAGGNHSIAGLRLAFAGDLQGLVPVDPEVMEICRRGAHSLEAAGCRLEDDSFATSEVPEIIAGTRAYNLVARYAERLARHGEKMTPSLINQVAPSLQVDVSTVAKAERQRTTYWHRVREFLQRYDAILTPTVGAPAFRLDQPLPSSVGGRPVANFFDIILSTYAFSIVGLPAISVPCGWTSAGLPVGLQIVGPRLAEDRVLALAAAFAAQHPENFKLPEIAPDTAAAVHPEFLTSFSRFVKDVARL